MVPASKIWCALVNCYYLLGDCGDTCNLAHSYEKINVKRISNFALGSDFRISPLSFIYLFIYSDTKIL